MKGFYIHIPFCKVKCLYCDFYKIIPKSSFEIDNFLRVLSMEIHENSCYYNTIFIGGGTPNILDRNKLIELFEVIVKNIKLYENYEWTIELNPELVNLDNLVIFKDYGINRLSLGIQSLDDYELKFMGRLHRKRDVFKKIDLIERLGFENVNVDIIFGGYFQDVGKFRKTLYEIVNFPITHISTYLLTIEDGTPFKKLNIKLKDEDTIEEMFKMKEEILYEHGFYRYEISNYAKKGFQCKHNLIYWKRESYIGVGPSAASFIKPNIRYKNVENLGLYLEDYKKYREYEFLNDEQILLEKIYLSLRLDEGLELQDISIVSDLTEFFNIYGNRIKPNIKGIMVLDRLAIEIFQRINSRETLKLSSL
ncbi:MAG: radical SAM family heme chaperone HemW [candidate division WOR-3 bacterium]|nr:radical SAM family heme chaperone HemW [candidate division WOR-3 bacterium]MCX7947257.1 radical SAM family heme chaperone HemW [candidate division WOR-3 bacterium]MDW8150186.1 radical SAM family heme chaperone HemW [candidate division WOR-3 bacterium]